MKHEATIVIENYGETLEYQCSCGYVSILRFPTSIDDVINADRRHMDSVAANPDAAIDLADWIDQQ